MDSAVLVIVMRWLHIVSACLAVGGVFFMRILVPIALGQLEDPEARKAVFLRLRRSFKMVIHPAILMFLVSGIYNTIRLWPQYSLQPGLTHAFFGMHLILSLAIMGIALWMLAGKEPPASHRSWMLTNLILMFLTIAAAGGLKFAREKAVDANRTPIAPATL